MLLLRGDDGAMRDDAAAPLRLVGVLEALQVEHLVEVFKEPKPDDTIVGVAVLGDGCGSGVRVLVVDSVDAAWIEYFVDAIIFDFVIWDCSCLEIFLGIVCSDGGKEKNSKFLCIMWMSHVSKKMGERLTKDYHRWVSDSAL